MGTGFSKVGKLRMERDVTRLLRLASKDGSFASEDLLPLVYDELRKLASVRMSEEIQGQTIQATALVHEAWLKLSGKDSRTWNDRAHFFRSAAQAMRRILVDRARHKLSQKGGRRQEHLDIGGLELAESTPDDRILMVNEKLAMLETDDPESAQIITLKFFGGLTNREIAEVQRVTERTIERQWAYAKASLYRMIQEEAH